MFSVRLRQKEMEPVSRALLAVASMLTSLVIVASGSVAAYAAEYKVEGKAIASGESFETAGTGGASTLTLDWLGEEFPIVCTGQSSVGTITSGGASTATISYSGCKITKPAGCRVSETLKPQPITDLLASATEDVFTGEGTTEFYIELEITKCAIKGKYKITGKQACELPSGGVEAAGHEVVCKTNGSKLHLGSERVTYEGTQEIKLASGKKFSS